MSKCVSFLKLDFITVKPYLTLKNFIIFCIFSFFVSFGTESSSTIIGIFSAYACIYVSYPFAVGEQNGIDVLYTTLSLKRKDVVIGRYLFALCINLLMNFMGFILSFIIFKILNKPFDFALTLSSLAVTMSLFMIIQMIQIPVYFKLGYAKAKSLAFLTSVGIAVLVVGMTSIFIQNSFMQILTTLFEWIDRNIYASAGLFLMIILFILFISYSLSLKFYEKRDF